MENRGLLLLCGAAKCESRLFAATAAAAVRAAEENLWETYLNGSMGSFFKHASMQAQAQAWGQVFYYHMILKDLTPSACAQRVWYPVADHLYRGR